MKNAILIRSLQYRLQRQGMLELDVWLSPLISALEVDDPAVVAAVESLMQHEVPELLAMQTGTRAIPKELEHWLST